MGCFSCFGSGGDEEEEEVKKNAPRNEKSRELPNVHENHQHKSTETTPPKDSGNGNIAAVVFTFRELAAATKNFKPDCLLGEGGFGRVYKGFLENTKQVVAVKQLDRNGLQGNNEFLVEVLMLSQLHHRNLVNLVGYCSDGDQRLLVYEFMSLGSLEDHLLDIMEVHALVFPDLQPDQKPMDWRTRMNVALGAAEGIEYLHDKASPPVIYRDLKSSNILLDQDFSPKLSDFGLAKLSPIGENVHVSSRIMGTYGYCAPEYVRTGELTQKSDVYSFGVVMLELITGRRAMDPARPIDEQNLVAWAQPKFKDQKRFPELVDPLLEGRYPTKSLNQAATVAAMCLNDEASVRPLMADVVVAVGFLCGDSTGSSAPAVEEPPEDSASSDAESEEEDASGRRESRSN